MADQKLDWVTLCGGMDSLPEEQTGWRSLAVSDGCIASETALPEGVAVHEGLEDYAAGYDVGDDFSTILVWWELWEGGIQKDRGKWSFEK